ncbi:hypothetical protein ACE193_12585 [Bernardetia sp. OM2101]|uniref:hypothetical protein n=1 Tax=Bernardetia sp. OM2101 TaxID=3344876 RepID=UPI0035CF7358
MKTIFIFLFFFLFSLSLQAQNIPISDSLIRKISFSQMENYDENYEIMLQLSKEVITYTNNKKDSIFGNISVFYANFDEDEDIELIAFFGRIVESNFLVFDKIDNQWFLIYREEIGLDTNRELFYGISPTENTPLVWVKYHDGHGSGVYSDRYFFYKFTQKGFKKVLSLAGENWVVPLASYTSFSLDLETTFECYPDGDFIAHVGGKYYLPYDFDKKGNSTKLILFRRWIQVIFKWDEEKQEYFPSFRDYNKLSEEQKEFILLKKEDAELFIDLFRIELYEMRKDLSERELEVLDEWINNVMERSKSKK